MFFFGILKPDLDRLAYIGRRGMAGVGDEAAHRIAGEVNCRIEGVKA
ncbi:MAG: hypothetical protein IJY30_05970 [Muribaculaceae bacterium]|nr:hypothetical protein [Muribaculaceae bacterium]